MYMHDFFTDSVLPVPPVGQQSPSCEPLGQPPGHPLRSLAPEHVSLPVTSASSSSQLSLSSSYHSQLYTDIAGEIAVDTLLGSFHMHTS